MSSVNIKDTQFLFYQPNNSANNPQYDNTSDPTPTQRRSVGRPKGLQGTPKFVSDKEMLPKRSVGRPRGSGHKQKAEKEAERQRRLEPQPYQAVGLVVPGTGSNPTSWDTLMQPRPIHSTSRQPAPLPPRVTPSVSTRTTSNSNSLHSNIMLADPHTTETTSEIPDAESAFVTQTPSSSLRTVLERARTVALSSDQVETYSEPPCLEPDPESLSSSINTDNLTFTTDEVSPEDSLDSLMAEGIGEDDMGDVSEDEDEFKDDEDNEEDQEPGNESQSQDGSSKQEPKKKRIRKPYPTWFQACLDEALSQVKADRANLAGRSRLYAAGTFWFPEKSVWSILQKIHIRPSDLFVPKFFLWDPDELKGGIGCPFCNQTLHRHGILPRPRRVIDIDCSFWIIGFAYRCPSCKKCFRSWDRRILAKLDVPLAAQFPAHLSWRSGLSLRAFGVLRSCIQSGMGAHQVAAMFRVQHLLRYDELRRQYLHTVLARVNLPGQAYHCFPPFEDTSSDGLHGFVPSGQWFRDVYDGFIESHKDDFNQHTALLSGRVCAIDHSYKLAKHIAKIDGVPIFIALLTVTNEKGEIRVCNFVATKAHSQFTDALKKMRASLSLYGHTQPEIFYTDNMADKAMLEECFPSLLEGIVPVEKNSGLPLFSIPASIIPKVLDSTPAIDNALRAIMDLLPVSGGCLAVGFDTEWNVDVADDGRIRGRGPTAVVQIALRDQIYILKIGRQVASQQLPHQLVLFLKDPRIIKAGRMVTADLRHLETISGKGPFLGGIELGTLAKQRFLVPDARISLADLAAEILGKCLPKNCAERISTNWDDDELTPAQIDYASLDAYVSWMLFDRINAIPLPELITPSTPFETKVNLLSSDKKKIIAHGTLTSPSDVGIQLTSTQATVRVDEIIVPGAKLQKRALRDFGELPFSVICLRSLLRVRPASHIHLTPKALPHSIPTKQASTDFNTCNNDASLLQASVDSDLDSEVLSHVINSEPTEAVTAELDSAECDDSSTVIAQEVLGPRNPVLPQFAEIIRSRVLKDPFHVFNMIYLPKSHALRIPFAQALRDAMFIPHPEDKRRVLDWIRTKGLTWDFMLKFKSRWVWKHVRRTIPPPELLYPAIHDVFSKYGPLKDAKTGLPLFSASTWKVVKNILDLARNGFLSDPPGVPLYYCIGLDFEAGGLRVWRCIRGTNMTEGGVHTHLRPRMPTRGTSIRHMRACLLDFVLHHNLHVGTFNSIGQKFRHHDYIWLTNEIQELELTLAEYYPQQSTLQHPSMSIWINGNLYKQTNEEIGILPLPSSVIEASGMRPHMHGMDRKQQQAFLARLQGTAKAVLPICSIPERKLFSHLMLTCKDFYTSRSELSVDAVKIWNRHAETNADIYYKLSEHLSQYASGDWEKTANLKQSLSQAFEITNAVQKQTRDPGRSNSIIHATEAPLLRQQVTKGFLEQSGTHNDSDANAVAVIAQISHKRAMDAQPEPATKRIRTSRHCIRCGRGAGQCKGSSAWFMCQYSCRDCGSLPVAMCAGRNSKHPNKPRCGPPSELTPAARKFLGI